MTDKPLTPKERLAVALSKFIDNSHKKPRTQFKFKQKRKKQQAKLLR